MLPFHIQSRCTHFDALRQAVLAAAIAFFEDYDLPSGAYRTQSGSAYTKQPDFQFPMPAREHRRSLAIQNPVMCLAGQAHVTAELLASEGKKWLELDMMSGSTLLDVSGSQALLEALPPPPRMQVATHFLAQPCTSLLAMSLPRLRGADPSPE